MKCEDLLKAMNEYVDGTLEPGLCDEFEQHLTGCNPCQIVIDNIRRTIKLYRAGEEYPVPPAFEKKLRECLRDKWRREFGT